MKLKQLFTNELKDRLKDIGDFAFVVDKKDIVVRLKNNDALDKDNIFFFFKENTYTRQQLEELRNNQKQELYDLLTNLFNIIDNPNLDLEEYKKIFPDDDKFNAIIDALNWFGFYEGE